MKWNEVVKVVENDFGMQVDWEERFFVCPEKLRSKLQLT